MKESTVKDKSKQFALRIIRLSKYLSSEKKEFVLSKQVLRCGTSIGANVAEAFYGQSSADFISKFCIAEKEAGETKYWLELLHDSDYISDVQYESMNADVEELLKLLASSIITMRKKQQ